MNERRVVEVSFVPHPTDCLVRCDECGESLAEGADDVGLVADWVERHFAERHGR